MQKATAGKLLLATGQFLSRFIYTTSYAFSYRLMFPVVLIVKSMPADNVVTHGFINGAQAANEKVVQMKIRHLKSPAAPGSNACQDNEDEAGNHALRCFLLSFPGSD